MIHVFRFHSDVFHDYLNLAPAALALERTIESRILSEQDFQGPVLDIGCGDGIFAAVVFDRKIDTGVDLDPVEIATAKQYGAYAELLTCSAAAIPKPDSSYRTIFSNSVLEHIPELNAVLKEAHRLLAPGGHFYITIPTDRLERYSAVARLLATLRLSGLLGRYIAFYNRFWKHYHAYPESQWRTLVTEAGFRVVEERSYIPKNLSTAFDLITVFGLPAVVTKKLTGHWIAFPALRRLYSGVIAGLLANLLDSTAVPREGALVFYALTRD